MRRKINMNNAVNENPVACFTEKWQSLGHMYEEYAKSKGLTYMSFIVLEAIYKHPAYCMQKLICEQTLYTKQSVNAIIKTFWRQGDVELKEEETDRRNKRILFTEKGQKYADEIIGKFSAVEYEAMGHLSGEQWRLLIEMADTFSTHFISGLICLIQSAERR